MMNKETTKSYLGLEDLNNRLIVAHSQMQRYSIVYSTGHKASTFLLLIYFSPEALHMDV